MIKLTEEDYNLMFNALEMYASWLQEKEPSDEEQKKQKEEILKQIQLLQDKLDIY